MYRCVLVVAICFFVFILWVIYLANTGGDSVFFDFVRSIPHGDKLGHMGLFGGLSLVAIVGSKFRGFMCGPVKIYYGAAAVILFVVIEEISQAFIPARSFDLMDLAADVVGMAFAVGVAYWMEKRLIVSAN